MFSFHDEQKRRQTEEEQELEEIKQEVFNLPDNINNSGLFLEKNNNLKIGVSYYIQLGSTDSGGDTRTNVTERLAINRQKKFDQVWNEFMEKIAELNQVISLFINKRCH